MRQSRRKFILSTSAAMAGSAIQGAKGDEPPLLDLRAELQARGYNPGAPDAALIAVIGDPHISLSPDLPQHRTERWDDFLIGEINGLQPMVTDLIAAGDLISIHSASVGASRYPSSLLLAREEFRLAKKQLQRFRSNINVWAVPGNHDTDAFETNADLWREEMQMPPFQKTVIAGVPVFLLNSGNGGMMNADQIAWFKQEVSAIPKDQEVMVIAHHPSFFYKWLETGLRRVLVETFENRGGMVWLAGGHGHYFSEYLYKERGTRFMQTMVTSAHQNNPTGYALYALQAGRVLHRMFRSTKTQKTESRPRASQMPENPARWAFEEIQYPAEILEEGFYDRTNRLISVRGVDVGCHFVYCKAMTVRASLSRFGGKVDTFVLGGEIRPSAGITPTCSLSATGLHGSWMNVPFPAPKGSGLYNVAIPASLQNADHLYVRLETGLTNYYYGFSVCGWALAAKGERLTAYEKWISRTFRTLASTGPSAPDSITPRSNLPNLVNFGFNLASSLASTSSASAILPPEATVMGLPEYSRTFRQVVDFRFARRIATSIPGVSCHVEESTDLRDWLIVSEDRLLVRALDPVWEEVTLTMAVRPGSSGYCRVKFEETDQTSSAFRIWADQEAVAGAPPGDVNADGIADLMQFAFDLDGNDGAARPYDAQRAERKAGIPIHAFRMAKVSRIVFPRMRASANPGIRYTVEATNDLQNWNPLQNHEFSELLIRSEGDWDEVEVIIFDQAHPMRMYRIRLEVENPLPS